METKSTEPGPRLNEDQQEIRLNTTGELNLYLDLLAFSEMSPADQQADKERQKTVAPNPVFQSPAEFPGFVETGDPFDEILSPRETTEPVSEAQLFESLPEPIQAEPLACDPLAFLETAATPDQVFEFLPASEPVESEQIAAVEAVDVPAPADIVTAPAPETNEMFRASGPLSLSGLLYDPTLKTSAQIVTLVVCPACGSEADGDDLFCVTCGAFISEKAADEAGKKEASELACDDCGLVVATGELICPACGSLSPTY